MRTQSFHSVLFTLLLLTLTLATGCTRLVLISGQHSAPLEAAPTSPSSDPLNTSNLVGTAAAVGNGVLTVVNAANYAPTVAPGSIVVITGHNLADAPVTPATPGNSVGGVQVTMGGEPATLLYVSPTQINAVMPGDLPEGTNPVQVIRDGGSPQSDVLTVAAVAPGIFTANEGGTGVAAAQTCFTAACQTYDYNLIFDSNTDAPVAISTDQPSQKSYLLIYGTGWHGFDGSQITATIDGISVPIAASGSSSQDAGLDEVNLELPAALATSHDHVADVVVRFGNERANTVQVAISANPALPNTEAFSFESGGLSYTVRTQAAGRSVTMNGHWLYEPSVVLPAPETGNQYTLLFTSNLVSAKATESGEAIFMATSSDGISFTTPTPVLEDKAVSNLCDMADARPVWDGQTWHVYIQALIGPWNQPCAAGTDKLATIVEASGPTLTQLSWVTEPGTNQIRSLLTPLTGDAVGIGEGMQWFNLAQYIPGMSFLVAYNDWGYSAPGLNGGAVFVAPSSDGTQISAPTVVGAQAWDSVMGTPYPDVLLAGSANADSIGIPAFGIGGNCKGSSNQYIYGLGAALYPGLVPAPKGGPLPAFTIDGALASVTEDATGPRMSSPKIGRNSYGLLDPQISASGSRTWQTFVYYDDAQMNEKPTDGCSSYSNWNSTQYYSASQLTITEN